jgi:vacuolar-type H+-ATPase subunit I/STV1
MSKITLFKVIIQRNLKDSLLMELADQENVHIKEREQEKIEKKTKEYKDIIKNLRINLRDLFKKLNISVSELNQITVEDKEKKEFKVKDLYELTHHMTDETNFYMNRINELERYINKATLELESVLDIESTYRFLDKFNFSRKELRYFDQLDMKTYITYSKNLPNLRELFQFEEFPNVYQYSSISDDRIVFFIIYPKRQEEELRERINIIHGKEIPILKKYLTYDGINFERIDKEIDLINKTLGKYQKELERLRNENLKKFAAINEVVENLEEYNWAENQFSSLSSDRVVLKFYVPSEDKMETRKKLKKEFKSKIRIEDIDIEKQKKVPKRKLEEKNIKRGERANEQSEGEEEEKEEDLRKEAPSRVTHNRIVRPFETLTKMYGIPTYSEIDPTPFLFFTFPFLFGIMFGDIGHGIVLIISGFIGAITFRERYKVRNISWIVFYCGWWAILFGFLYGEFFGGHQILGYHIQPVAIPLPFIGFVTLFSPLNNVMALFYLTIFVGVLHINLGWIIRFINYCVQRKFYQAFTEPILKILFLDFLVFLVLNWGIDINAWLSYPYPILLPIVPGLLLIILKPFGKLLGISYLKGESYGELISEGSMETFETVLSLPSNVLSYLRLLALALAHISLMVAVEAMIQIITIGGILEQIIIIIALIFGNALVILLEGVIVFLNALRLNFYEFFFKFYEGRGIEYDPFILEDHYSKIIFRPEMERDVISEEIEKEIESKKAKQFIEEARQHLRKKYL